jgi:fermentation-respiration switch protein FrsA (DUF1100 family)
MPKTPPRPRWTRTKKFTWRVVRLAVVAYLAVMGFLYLAQTWLIFPGRSTQGKAYAQVEPRKGLELIRMKTALGDDVVALFGAALSPDGSPAPDASACPTVLFFYGNGDCLAANVDLLGELRRRGANVMIPEYAGYGMSGGSPSEAGCYATADAAYDHLASRPDVDPTRIYAAGWSLGSGVAVDLASRRPVAGLVIFSSFTSMVDMGRLLYPWVPVSLLLEHRFESEAKIAKVTCPMLIGHGRQDRAIPFAMSDRLAAAARSPVTRIAVDRADHNDLFYVGGRALYDAIGRFVSGQ